MARWSNWSGSVECQPAEILYPRSEAEIIAALQRAQAEGRGLRVMGSGHSFTPLVATDALLLSLQAYQGLLHVDSSRQQVTVKAGTSIQHLGALLFELGLAQENLGDIDEQSIAGAISTGTHGSGLQFGSLSTQVVALRLITAAGEVLELSATQQPALFRAAQVSLGALGIISSVTLQAVPAFVLDYEWRVMGLDECLQRLEEFQTQHRNFEFYWLPYTERVMCKFMNITEAAARPKSALRRFQENVVENGALWLLSEMARLRPSLSRRSCQWLAALVSSGRDRQYSHQIFTTARLVRFQEMEYSLPLEAFRPALLALKAHIEREQVAVNFPVECRFCRRDDIPLSMNYGRDAAYLALHMYRGMPYEAYFQAAEGIFGEYEGRPHWGKMHSLSCKALAPLYPQWGAFQQARQQLDPSGRFMNAYLRRIFC